MDREGETEKEEGDKGGRKERWSAMKQDVHPLPEVSAKENNSLTNNA